MATDPAASSEGVNVSATRSELTATNPATGFKRNKFYFYSIILD